MQNTIWPIALSRSLPLHPAYERPKLAARRSIVSRMIGFGDVPKQLSAQGKEDSDEVDETAYR